MGFPCSSPGKESTSNVGDVGTIPALVRPTGEGKGYALQYSGLENSLDCIVHGVAKSRTQLSNFHFQPHDLVAQKKPQGKEDGSTLLAWFLAAGGHHFHHFILQSQISHASCNLFNQCVVSFISPIFQLYLSSNMSDLTLTIWTTSFLLVWKDEVSERGEWKSWLKAQHSENEDHGIWTNLDSIFKSRDISLPTKVRLVKATVFPVVIYGCESWTVKKAECWRIDAFELWCWRRLLRVPWTARRSNRSILKEINSEYSLEGLMLRLKLQYFGHLMWSTDAGNGWRREEKGSTEDEVIGCITDSTDMSMSKLRELVMDRKAWRAAVHGVTKSHMWLSDWSELNWTELSCLHQQYFWVRTTHRSILQIREILLHLVNYKCLLFCVSNKPPSDANAASAKPMLCVARVENEVWKISRAPLNEEASSSCM